MARTIRYFEAKGKTKRLLAEMLRKRHAALDQLRIFVGQHGGHRLAFSEGFSFSSAIGMDDDTSEPDGSQDWRRHKKNRRVWEPRKTTAQGKKIATEMKKLDSAVVSQADFGAAIKLNYIGNDLHINVPGIYPVGKGIRRLLLAIPSASYKPPKGIELVRISDTLFEKLTKE